MRQCLSSLVLLLGLEGAGIELFAWSFGGSILGTRGEDVCLLLLARGLAGSG